MQYRHVGHIPIDVKRMGIDMLSLSGHKLGAPKGVGALYVKSGIKLEKLIDGGHQERDKRAGTENVAGIVALGKACELARENLNESGKYLKVIRKYFITKVGEKISTAKLNGSRTNRIPSNSNFCFQGIDGEALLLNLDARGICASAGSACSSGSSNPSHVLTAIGLSPEEAHSSLRISFGEENTKEDVDYLVNSIVEIIEKLTS